MIGLDSKRTVMERLLSRGNVRVQLVTSHPCVIVPEHLRAKQTVCLEYGYDLIVPIADLAITDRGIEATLSFNRTPCFTFVPWDAVYMLTGADGSSLVFPASLPAPLATDAPTTARHPAAGFLRLVKGGNAPN